MLRRLRARITLLAALLTGAVLTGALLFAFGVTCRQYSDSRRSAFETAVTQLQYQWDRYDQLDGDWLARLEAQNGMKVLLTENGAPLLHSLHLGEEERALLEAAKRAAEEQQGLLADAPPLAGSQSASFTFRPRAAAGGAKCGWTAAPAAGGRALWRCRTLAPSGPTPCGWPPCSRWWPPPGGPALGWQAGSSRAGRCARWPVPWTSSSSF